MIVGGRRLSISEDDTTEATVEILEPLPFAFRRLSKEAVAEIPAMPPTRREMRRLSKDITFKDLEYWCFMVM